MALIVSGKGVKEIGKRSEYLVEFVDIFPTLCEKAGLKIPKGLQGKSFAPILENVKVKTKESAFSQFLLGRFPRKTNAPEKMGYAVRTNQYRYVEWFEWKEDKRGAFLDRELFDHFKDPKENVNKANIASNKGLCLKLEAILKSNFK